MTTPFENALATVKQHLADKTWHNWGLSAFMLRDYQETKDAGLHELCWDCASEQWGCSRGDVEYIVEQLEKRVTHD